MIKSELILRVASENPHLDGANVERVVNTILGRISDALVTGDRVELRGLGVFTTTERSARTGRNPKTGEVVSVETKKLLQLKPSRLMHARLNPSGTVISAEVDSEVERLLRVS